MTGQRFYLAEQQGDWSAIYYGGQKVWFYNPGMKNTVPGSGTLITPRAGLSSIPVYGRAYPDSNATLGYTIPAGQVYVATDLVTADHYVATTFNDLPSYYVLTSGEQFYQISFNHRIAFVKASDVQVVSQP